MASSIKLKNLQDQEFSINHKDGAGAISIDSDKIVVTDSNGNINLSTSPAQFDNDNTVATTAFVQRALGNYRSFSSISAAYTLTASDIGKAFRLGSSGYAITLPLVSSVSAGSTILLKHTGTNGTITIQRQGTDAISFYGDSKTSFTLSVGDSVLLINTGADWTVMGGEAALAYSSVFGASTSLNGYQKLPSGLIIQWQQHTTINGTNSVTFPIAFPNACLIVIPCVKQPTIGSLTAYSYTTTASSITANFAGTSTVFSIGY